MLINQMYQSQWIRAEDLGNEDHPVTIEAVEYDTQKKANGEVVLEYYLRLKEFPKKRMGLNKTNAKVIAGIYGEETDAWIGKRITIYATEGQVFDEIKLVLRVRLRPPESKQAEQKMGVTAADRLASALKAKGLDLEDLRAWLELQKNKDALEVHDAPPSWPASWVSDIAEWLKAPVKVNRPAGHEPLTEEDIPF